MIGGARLLDTVGVNIRMVIPSHEANRVRLVGTKHPRVSMAKGSFSGGIYLFVIAVVQLAPNLFSVMHKVVKKLT